MLLAACFWVGWVLCVIVIIVIGYSNDRKSWNNGACPKCSTPWTYFDTDSQGGDGYLCHNCNRYIWLTYLKQLARREQREQGYY